MSALISAFTQKILNVWARHKISCGLHKVMGTKPRVWTRNSSEINSSLAHMHDVTDNWTPNCFDRLRPWQPSSSQQQTVCNKLTEWHERIVFVCKSIAQATKATQKWPNSIVTGASGQALISWNHKSITSTMIRQLKNKKSWKCLNCCCCCGLRGEVLNTEVVNCVSVEFLCFVRCWHSSKRKNVIYYEKHVQKSSFVFLASLAKQSNHFQLNSSLFRLSQKTSSIHCVVRVSQFSIIFKPIRLPLVVHTMRKRKNLNLETYKTRPRSLSLSVIFGSEITEGFMNFLMLHAYLRDFWLWLRITCLFWSRHAVLKIIKRVRGEMCVVYKLNTFLWKWTS